MRIKSSQIGFIRATQRLHVLYAIILFLLAIFQLYMVYEFSVVEDFVINGVIAKKIKIYFFVLALFFLVFYLLLGVIRRRKTVFNKMIFMWLLLLFRLGVIVSLSIYINIDLSNPYSLYLYIISILILLLTIPTNYKVGAYLNLTEEEFVEAYEKRNEPNVTEK